MKPRADNALQLDLIRAVLKPHRYIALQCGWGAGKTAGLVFSIMAAAVQSPGETHLVLTDTYPRYTGVLEPEMRHWLGAAGWEYRPSSRTWYDPQTRTTVYARSWHKPSTRAAEANPLEGMNLARAFIDECQTLPEDVIVRVMGRLRAGKVTQVVMAGLPVFGGGWWTRYAEERGGCVLRYGTHVNTALPDDYLEAMKELPPSVYRAMVEGNPAPPEGLVYSAFRAEPWPAGNLTPADWSPPEDARFRLAADFGLRKPSVLIICEDPAMGDVVVADIEPREVTVGELAAAVLKVAWPRDDPRRPADRIPLDTGCGDKAGRARNDQTLRSTFDILRQPAPDGLGLNLRHPRGSLKTNIANGVRLMQGLIEQRRWLIASELWWSSLRAEGNNLAKALVAYRWKDEAGTEPLKDGLEDPLDAARYDLVVNRWRATRPGTATRTAPAPASAPEPRISPRRRGVRSGRL